MSRSPLRRIRSDSDGVAAVEFAIAFPVLVLLFFGAFEISYAVVAHKKVQKMAYTIDHLITKTTPLDADTVQKTMGASLSLLAPLDGSSAAISMTYTYVNASGSVAGSWSQSYPSSAKAPTAISLPQAFSALREVGYLSTQVRYTHSAVFPGLFFTRLEMTAKSIVRPRPGMPLTCANC